jgi:nucleoside-diphosphate-sugar epimerase
MRYLVCGAGGFIGSHLVKRLVAEGHAVFGADLKKPLYEESPAENFYVSDLRDRDLVEEAILDSKPDRIIQLAADMGGAGFVFTGDNDANIMHNSCQINLNIAEVVKEYSATIGKRPRIFYSSSACVYPTETPDERTQFEERDAYPAMPDNDYGWEKLFSERLYFAYARNYGLDVRVARFHNVYGPEGTYSGGREKAPAAICRKVAESNNGTIELWGDGTARRSFLYIDQCVEGVLRFMDSDSPGPLNIGSDVDITIADLAKKVIAMSGKDISINWVRGPVGVAARNSENTKIKKVLNWAPETDLDAGLVKTYNWIAQQVSR